jgi:hypothetical protein
LESGEERYVYGKLRAGILESADQHKQIGIRRRATSFNMRTVFIKQNGNFENSQDLKG